MRCNEPTQPGNPYKLTINQHIFPTASIERFTKSNGKVNVYLIDNKRNIYLNPKDQVFVAKRVWNNAAEKGFMKIVEDEFQGLVNSILNNRFGEIFDDNQNKIISNFYALCRLRFEESKKPPQDIQLNGFPKEIVLTKDEEEILESNQAYSISGSVINSRNLASFRLHFLYPRLCSPETKWSLVYSRNIQFIVPDSFGNIGVVPLTPNYCLVANQQSGEISSDNAVQMNKLAIEKSSKYYFAHDLSMCGVDLG